VGATQVDRGFTRASYDTLFGMDRTALGRPRFPSNFSPLPDSRVLEKVDRRFGPTALAHRGGTGLTFFFAFFGLFLGTELAQAANLMAPPDVSVSSIGAGRPDPFTPGLSLLACERFDPEASLKGGTCCMRQRPRLLPNCAPSRRSSSHCAERTYEQLKWATAYQNNPHLYRSQLLERISQDDRQKAFCTVNDGFLAWGVPLLELPDNRVKLRSAFRCANFGVPRLIAALDWLGTQMAGKFLGPVELLIGDLSGPKGGCLAGMRGRRAHRSHTSGLDADIAFPVAKGSQPGRFHGTFEPETMWWVMKQLFSNPHACVAVVYLDRRLISKLGKAAGNDPDWELIRKHLKHVSHHRNHIHVRVKDAAGGLNCLSGVKIEEEDLENDSPDEPTGPADSDGASASEE
jgi:murein endopeptidase